MIEKFIELTLLNCQNDRLKTKAWVRADQIVQVIRPSERDLAQQKDAGAILQLINNSHYMVEETPAWIMEQLGQPIDER